MQTSAQREGVRTRLLEVIRQKHGEVTSATVAALARRARVHYTSLARFVLYASRSRTRTLRRRTLEAVALALDVAPEWIRDGQGPKQLAFWPILLPADPEGGAIDPEAQVPLVLELIRPLPDAVRVRAYRAAVAAVIEIVTDAGGSPGAEAYRCLMRLDAAGRAVFERAVS